MTTASSTTLAGFLGLVLSLQPTAGLALASTSLGQPSSPHPIELAQRRGGGGGGGSRSAGGSRSSGSRSSGSRGGSGARTGFSAYSGSSNRQGSRETRQSTRQASQGSRQTNRSSNQATRQGNRQTNQSARQGSRQVNQTNRQSSRDSRQNTRQDALNTRQTNRTDRVKTRNDTYRKAVNNWDRYGNGWYSNSGWYNNRPWNSGWYGSSYWNNWGWYPGRAAAWGIAGMATFGVINSLVNSAQSNQVSYIVVPQSSYSLYYPSVTASGDVVTFEADNGYDTVRYSANCRQGALNGGAPRDSNEAQLLNAACQVAFGQ